MQTTRTTRPLWTLLFTAGAFGLVGLAGAQTTWAKGPGGLPEGFTLPEEGLIGPLPGETEHVHDDGESECCGLDAKRKLSRFQAAITQRQTTARHRIDIVQTQGGAGHPAVFGNALCELASGADLQAILKTHHARALIPLGPSAWLVEATDPARSTLDLLAALEADERVVRASPNWVARAQAGAVNDPLYAEQQALRHLNIEAAWAVTRGEGVLLAVLDTGVDAAHEDLGPALGPKGWLDLVAGQSKPYDDHGHGTAVAGIAIGRADDAHGTAGVAPEADLLAIKVADADGQASFAHLIQGIDAAIARGAQVVAIALGAHRTDPLLESAIKRARLAGVVVLAAAGNENVEALRVPAALPGVIAVGGASAPGQLGVKTALSEKPMVLAPTGAILAPVPGGLHGVIGGTSAATAQAAGVAALCLARSPDLNPDRIAQALVHGSHTIDALAPLYAMYPHGTLDAERALARANRGLFDGAVLGFTTAPSLPAPGQPATVRARVRNEGTETIATAEAILFVFENGTRTEISRRAVTNLGLGEVREVTLDWPTPPAAGTYDVEVQFALSAQEIEVTDNLARHPVTVSGAPLFDGRIRAMRALPNDLMNRVELEGDIENAGTLALTDIPVRLLANGKVIQTTLVTLAPGQTQTVRTAWTPPGGVSEDATELTVELGRHPGETDLAQQEGTLRLRLGSQVAAPPNVLYQQSNDVDVIWDAPYRVGGSRGYIPLMLFVPNTIDPGPNAYVTFNHFTVDVKDSPGPAAPGTRIFTDKTGSPVSFAASGITRLDDQGQLAPDLEMFDDKRLYMNGRHNFLRVPRSALGLPSPLTQPTLKYLLTEARWRFRRKIVFVTVTIRTQTTRKVLEVLMGNQDLPDLPGEGHYYDIHNHTIAEWYFDNSLNLFAPRKAYGGPLAMVNEAAFAVGMIADPANVKDLVATTDHNVFFNETVGDPNHPGQRPPFGLSSPAASIGPGGQVRSESEQYRAIYGLSAGEEVAVRENQDYFVGGVNLALEIGSHMVSYRGEHIEGPWHGGGSIPDPAAPPNSTVELDQLYRQWGQFNQAENSRAFAYAAHPLGGQGWYRHQYELALGLAQQYRTLDHVHLNPPAFVFKGLQLWNGRNPHSLPSGSVDFNDLNPFVHPNWQSPRKWDSSLLNGLLLWHEFVADSMTYAFNHEPDLVFIRKVFIGAGSDAHGDFNFSTSRLATPIPIQQTYGVGASPYGIPRTYVMTDGVPGGTEGERYMTALAGGRSVLTDGPLLKVTMDGEGRFDATNLQWHDQLDAAEDDDGLIGGHGAFDGGGTLLCFAGKSNPWYRYRYETMNEFGSNQGAIVALNIYKDSPGAPNQPGSSRGPGSVGSLDLGAGPGLDLTEPLDMGEEGPIDTITALQFAAFTGANPDNTRLDGDERRCYTNPIWAVPVELTVSANAPAGRGVIPAGELTATLTFPISMDPANYLIEVKPLDAAGDTTDVSQPALGTLTSSWSSHGGIRSSRLVLTNPAALDTTGDAYPISDRKTFCVYFRERPRDAHGNPLNALAFTFEVDGALPAGSVITPGTQGAGGSGGGGGGGGCAVGPGKSSAPLGLLALVALLACARVRRRRPASPCRAGSAPRR